MRGPDGSVRTDPLGHAEGRGAYLCDEATCRHRVASRPALLTRALRAPAGAIAPSLLAELAGETDVPAGGRADAPTGRGEGASR